MLINQRMRKPDASLVTSRTMSEAVNDKHYNMIISGKLEAIDIIFPLFDQILKRIHLSHLFTNFSYFILFLQGILQCFSFFPSNISNDEPFNQAIGKLTLYLCGFNINNPSNIVLTYHYILTGYVVILFVWIVFCLVQYHYYRDFKIWTLYISRFLFECITPVFLVPMSTVFGQTLIQLMGDPTNHVRILHFGSSLFFLAFFMFVSFIHILFMSVSPFVSRTFFATFEPELLITYLCSITIAEFSIFFVSMFSNWSQSLLCIIHLVFFFQMMNKSRKIPFINMSVNRLFVAFFALIVSFDIMLIVSKYIFKSPLYVSTLISITMGIIIYLISRPLLQKIVERIRCSLSNSVFETNDIPYDHKKEYFTNLYLHTNDELVKFYLRIGMETGADFFMDGSLIRFIMEFYSESELYAFCSMVLSFFPGHARLLSSVFAKLVKKRDLVIYHRFLVYEVNRVRMIRQTSVSIDFNDRMIAMKQINKKCYEFVKTFFFSTPDTVSSLYSLSQEIRRTRVLWIESIEDFPNASKAYEEYSSFLVECSTDFLHAVYQTRKISMIEKGHNFNRDYCYRSFITKFPFYLKDKILDLRGNIILKNISHRGSQNVGSKDSSSLDNDMDDMLAEEEEIIAKDLINQHKMRLAFQRSLDGRLSSWSSPYKSVSFWVMIFSIIISFFIYYYLSTFFDKRVLSIHQISHLSKARFYQSISRLCVLLNYANETGQFNLSTSMSGVIASEANLSTPLDGSKPYNPQIIYNSYVGRDYFNTFLVDLVQEAFDGFSVYSIAQSVLKQTLNSTICIGNRTMPNKTMSSLKAWYSYVSLGLVRLTIDKISASLPGSLFCNLWVNRESMTNSYLDYNSRESISQSSITKSNTESLGFFDKFIPIVSLIIASSLSFFVLWKFAFDLSGILKIIRELPQQIKENAMYPIKRETVFEEQGSTGRFFGNTFMIKVILQTFIMAIALPVVYYLSFSESNVVNSRFESMANWILLGGARAPTISESIEHLTMALLLRKYTGYTATTVSQELSQAEYLVKLVDINHKVLLTGSDTISPCVGFDATIDALHFSASCVPNISDTDPHESYRCSSSNQVIIFYRTYSNEILSKFDSVKDLSDPLYFDLLHLACRHLLMPLLDVSERIVTLSQQYYDTFNNTLKIYLLISFLGSIMIFLLNIRQASIFDAAYDAALVLIRRVPPNLLLSEDSLMSFVMNKKNREKKQDLSFAQQVIYNSGDAIFFLSKNSIVEMINPGVSRLLGYVPEQLLGQSISTIVNEESKNQLLQQINMIRNRQTSEVFEDHIVCLSDSNNQIQCHLTILGIKSESSHDISSFVVFLRDESELLNQQKNAETAKQKSEELLFQILPRDIVLRLNQGERDITFTVPSASVMFIDIVRFSDYSVNLTPQQIMGNLSLIFDSFDRFLSKYPLITKIKLIGDIYMCASGLFAPESASQTHSEQIIRFGLDCLYELEEINVRLNSNLSVRIGVNSGGPIIGGVLGFDKPVFDIIGDTINVASRLTSTCIPGKIQIPQTTYDLISQLDFSIEKRGEVFLKGKGKTMTYLVNQTGNSLFISGHSSTLELIQQQMKRD